MNKTSFGLVNTAASRFFALLVLPLVDCSGHGTCPPGGRIAPGSTCNGENLQCPYELVLTNCDGTPLSIPSNCGCVNGLWACPNPGALNCSAASADASVGGNIDGTSTGGASATQRPPRYSGSSCPFVYVWNGSTFEYETDLGGITIGLPPGVTANTAIPIEGAGTFYHKLPHAKYDDESGTELLIRETVRELSYVDRIRMLVVDHPNDYEVWSSGEASTNEWGYVTPLKFYTSRDARTPSSAFDQNGLDVTAALALVDNIPAPIMQDSLVRYDLDYGTIAHPERAKLLIDGWSVYAILSDVDVQPSVDVLDARNNWVPVVKFGAPYGDFKTVVVDLGGLLPNDTGKLRVNLGLENGARWSIDRIRIDDSAPVPVTVQELEAATATLLHGGRATLHRCTALSRGEALNDVNPDDPYQYGYGAFTRYGDVRELLREMDNKAIIMRHGDQISLAFPGIPRTGEDLTRSVFLQSDLTMKSFILEQNVDPLPFHGMSSYPYPSNESYPLDVEHQKYLSEYNTRVLLAP